jgi:hypothetical protein
VRLRDGDGFVEFLSRLHHVRIRSSSGALDLPLDLPVCRVRAGLDWLCGARGHIATQPIAGSAKVSRKKNVAAGHGLNLAKAEISAK